MRKGRIKYYFKNKNAVINDVGKLCDMNEQLEQELDKYKNIVDELERWLEDNIEYGDDDYYDMKAMGVESALNKLKELKGE